MSSDAGSSKDAQSSAAASGSEPEFGRRALTMRSRSGAEAGQ